MVVAPFLISQCYNGFNSVRIVRTVVAPFLISQCYNPVGFASSNGFVVAPFLISQCYNRHRLHHGARDVL